MIKRELIEKFMRGKFSEDEKNSLNEIRNVVKAFRPKIKDSDHFIEQIFALKTRSIRIKSIKYRNTATKPNEIKKEIERLAAALDKSQKMMQNLFPDDLKELKKFSPLVFEEYVDDKIVFSRNKKDSYIGRESEMLDYLIKFAKSKRLRDLLDFLSRSKSHTARDKGTLFAASNLCAEFGIEISYSRNGRFYRLVEWLLPDVNDPKYMIQEVAKKHKEIAKIVEKIS